MADTPFEISATLNATAQLLDEMSGPYEKLAAVAPSTHMENVRGYDVEYPYLKGIFVQFKRPYLLDYSYEPFSFHTDHKDQLRTLQRWGKKYPHSTFYAFPLVPEDSALNQTLERTLFIDASCLRENTSRVRVKTAPGGSDTTTIPVIKEIQGKVQGGDWYPLKYPSACCRMWDDFRIGLESPDSGMDPWVVEYYKGEHTDKDIHEDERPEESEAPVGVTLYQNGEPVRHPDYEDNSQSPTILDQMAIDAEKESFWEQGLTAGMLER